MQSAIAATRLERRQADPHADRRRVVRRNGGAVSYAVLDRAGVDRREVARELRAGRIRRVRRALVRGAGCTARRRSGRRVGGALTGGVRGSVCMGLWLLAPIRRPPRAGRPRTRLGSAIPIDGRRRRSTATASGVCVHYHSGGLPITGRGTHCSTRSRRCSTCARAAGGGDRARLGVESGRASRSATVPALRAIVPTATRECSSIGPIRAATRALETIVRLLLRGRRDPTPDAGRHPRRRSGRPAHRRPTGPRTRRRGIPHRGRSSRRIAVGTSNSCMRGYLVVRLTYRMVMRDWERVERGMLALIDRGEHRWGARAVRSRWRAVYRMTRAMGRCGDPHRPILSGQDARQRVGAGRADAAQRMAAASAGGRSTGSPRRDGCGR